MSVDPALLKEVSIFQLLDDDELAELAPQLDEKSYVAGQVIFKAGEPGGEMHLVLSGQVEVFLHDEDGQRVVLAEFGPGEIFGELSLLDGDPRSAAAEALSVTKTCVIDRGDLLALFVKRPHAALDILSVLGRRLRNTDELLRQRAARNPNAVIEERASIGDRIADLVARFGGSWKFINLFTGGLLFWIILNMWFLFHPFDPAPFIGLNLILSMLAALQAPIIMMSQNRQDAKDRVRAELDFQVNCRAELGVIELQRKVDKMKEDLLAAALDLRKALADRSPQSPVTQP